MAVMDQDIGKILNYWQLRRDPWYRTRWNIAPVNKFRRLAQGVGGRVKGASMIKFIEKGPNSKGECEKCDVRSIYVYNTKWEGREVPNEICHWGGNQINFRGEVATRTTKILVAKLTFNSVV